MRLFLGKRKLFGGVFHALLGVLVFFLLPCPAFAKEGFSEDPERMEAAADSVLYLEMFDENGGRFASGSGFMLFDGHTLVTNYHVVEDASLIHVFDEDGNRYSFTEVLIADKNRDLAILHSPEATGLKPFSLAKDRPLRGESAVAIGTPEGYVINYVTIGNIGGYSVESGVDLILFTAPISPGSSGGALFNDAGEIIGVTSGEAYHGEGNDLYYAIAFTEIESLYAQWDGVSAYPIAELAQARVDALPRSTPTPGTSAPSPAPKAASPTPGASAKTGKKPLPTPSAQTSPTPRLIKHGNGEVILAPDCGRDGRLTVTPPEYTDCYVYLKYVGDSAYENAPRTENGQSARRDMSFYCKAGGKTVTVSVPTGKYEVYTVTGTAFFGSGLLFGSDSMYFTVKGKYAPVKDETVIYDTGGAGAELSLKTDAQNTVYFEPIAAEAFPG